MASRVAESSSSGTLSGPGSSRRKSGRVSKLCSRFSPPREKTKVTRGRKKRKLVASETSSEESPLHDLTPDGQPFSCELCQSRYIVDPSRRQKNIRKKLSPRQRIDTATGRYLMLCNACGLSLKYQKKRPAKIKDDTKKEEEKEQYLSEAKSFAESLVANLGDANAEKLYCPRFTSKPCRCIQTYLVSGGRNENYRKRALYLLKLIKTAQKLSSQKCYDINEVISKKVRRKVGMGNGHKKSKAYESFVMTNRSQLRETNNLCEMAIKKILCYSNNFLFKRLKSEQRECRVEKVKGRGRKDGGLLCIQDIARQKCCLGKCVLMARTHGALLQEWRDRAAQGQSESRRVLAEMLTPSGLKTNCYNFIRMVTGITNSVISSVNSYMIQTSGCRDPPPHGLKAYWANHPKRRRNGESDTEEMPSPRQSPQKPEKNTTKPIAVSRMDLPQEPHVLDVMSRDNSHSLLSQGDATESLTLTECDVMSGVVPGENPTTLEFVTFIGPDGQSQIMQVPVMNCSSFEGLEQDVSLQDAASIPLESLRPSASKPEPGEVVEACPAYMDGDLLQGVRVHQDPNLGQTVDIILEKGDKSLDNLRIPISAQVLSKAETVSSVDPNDVAGISQFHIFSADGSTSPTSQVLCAGSGSDLGGTFSYSPTVDLQARDSLVTVVQKSESVEIPHLDSNTEGQDGPILVPDTMVSLPSYAEEGVNREHGPEPTLWRKIPPLQEQQGKEADKLSKSTDPDAISSQNQVNSSDTFSSGSHMERDTHESSLVSVDPVLSDAVMKSAATNLAEKSKSKDEKTVPQAAEPNMRKPTGITQDMTSVQSQRFQDQGIIIKAGEGNNTKVLQKNSVLQTDPQELIQRSQKVIAESEKVVGQSVQLAQRQVLPSSQVNEQLQTLLSQSGKLANQQQLTAMQLEQLSAAQSLQQLSGMQPLGVSHSPSQKPGHIGKQSINGTKPAVMQPVKLMPMVLPQQLSILQPEHLNLMMPFSMPSSLPSLHNIPTFSVVKTPQTATVTTAQALDPVQIMSYSQESQPASHKQTKDAKSLATVTQTLGVPFQNASAVSKALSVPKNKKSPFILPKQESSKAPSLSMAPQSSHAGRQLLLPVVPQGVTLTLGNDQKGTPQLLIPCLPADKPRNPTTKQPAESSVPAGSRPLLPSLKTEGASKLFIPISSAQQKLSLKGGEGNKLYGSKSNSIILQHPTSSSRGGSFSVQHWSSANAPVTFHPQGAESIQDLVTFSSVGILNKTAETAARTAVVPSRGECSSQKTKGNTSKASSKHHLKELLPVLPKTSQNLMHGNVHKPT